ncbi:MAG TPA: DUF5916 domain-containing protein [Candidatus Angelobacter sp.]|nr:DUF5916 domain-containing protein [Candidatus Angelobacter sp.]
MGSGIILNGSCPTTPPNCVTKPVNFLFVAALATALAAEPVSDKPGQTATAPSLVHELTSLAVPRLAVAPKLSDFEGMAPATDLARKMLEVEKFVQREPKDGAACTQRTQAYLGYTGKNFYVIFLAFDDNTLLMRARMLRRELIDDDDQVGLFLDTFNDHRHAYAFFANPYGIQQDAIFTENGNYDNSFDTVWRTQARIISGIGYMVMFEIPFKSLRFHPSPQHTWGILLSRVLPRNSERSYFPENSSRSQGWLIHEADINGFEEISPGRNMQFIPYASVGAFRSLDERDPAGNRFTGKHVEPKEGLDSKIVIKDSLVLDTTINPDFGQIESDDPQVTVNQRFAVFFPEKRPFFQENANYFQTPLNLVFTRRIVDPLYGARLTGKVGDWAIGSFFANDRAPGLSVISTDPLAGSDAYFSVFRLNREIGKGTSIGLIYTDREQPTAPNSFCTDVFICEPGHNRVGGFDTQIKINQNWQMNAQAVTSETKFFDGSHESGPAYQVYAERSSRKIEFNTLYRDISPGFNTDTGFVNRTDIRQFSNFFGYTVHIDGKHFVAHGPRLYEQTLWDHNGTRVDWLVNPAYEWDFQRSSSINVFGQMEHERLRPVDFSALTANQDYAHVLGGVSGNTQYFKWLKLNAEMDWSSATNFVPRTGPPVLAYQNTGSFGAVVRPTKGLTMENTYLMVRLQSLDSRVNIFNNHIIRSKWNYQFTKEFSLRLIGQYNATLANPSLTTLQTAKQFNGDVLFTYMVHPGTAIYVGYNSDLQNLDPSLERVCGGLPCTPGQTPDGILRTPTSFLNDGRQFFIKISYLFRY